MSLSNTCVLVDGETVEDLAPDDRGLAYGHGVFETIRFKGDQAPLWDQHIERLQLGSDTLGVNLKKHYPEQFLVQIQALLATHQLDHAVVKIIHTAGSGGRGYASPAQQKPRSIISVGALPADLNSWLEQGVRVITCNQTASIQPRLAGIKHLNRLDQVLARDEALSQGYEDGLMLDTEGRLVSGTMGNCFAVAGNRLITPRIEKAGVKGVMRNWVIEKANSLAMDIEEVEAPPEFFQTADELFLCNAVRGIWPIVQWDKQSLAIGQLTQRLQQQVADELF